MATITVEHNGKSYEVDEDGYLLNPGDWDVNWVDQVRTVKRIEKISNIHWAMIRFLNDYYRKKGFPPILTPQKIRIICKEISCNVDQFYRTFSNGLDNTLRRMAGLPRS